MKTLEMKKAEGEGEEQVLVKSVEMDDPTFWDEATQVAAVSFTNPKGMAFDYQGEVYLGKAVGDKKATSGIVNFNIPANSSKAVNFTVKMPKLTVATDTYHVYVAVSTGGVPIVTYVATEDVVVNIKPAIDIGTITWT